GGHRHGMLAGVFLNGTIIKSDNPKLLGFVVVTTAKPWHPFGGIVVILHEHGFDQRDGHARENHTVSRMKDRRWVGVEGLRHQVTCRALSRVNLRWSALSCLSVILAPPAAIGARMADV